MCNPLNCTLAGTRILSISGGCVKDRGRMELYPTVGRGSCPQLPKTDMFRCYKVIMDNIV